MLLDPGRLASGHHPVNVSPLRRQTSSLNGWGDCEFFVSRVCLLAEFPLENVILEQVAWKPHSGWIKEVYFLWWYLFSVALPFLLSFSFLRIYVDSEVNSCILPPLWGALGTPDRFYSFYISLSRFNPRTKQKNYSTYLREIVPAKFSVVLLWVSLMDYSLAYIHMINKDTESRFRLSSSNPGFAIN